MRGPGMGLIVGAGVSGGAAAAVRAFTTYDKWATLIGMGAGAAVGLAMTFGRKTKVMGWDVLWASLLTGAPRLIEEAATGNLLSGTYGTSFMGLGNPVHVLSGQTTATEMDGFSGTVNLGNTFGAVPIAGMQ